jgi:hypothetical protein
MILRDASSLSKKLLFFEVCRGETVNDFIITFKQQKEYPRFRPVWKLIDAS